MAVGDTINRNNKINIRTSCFQNCYFRMFHIKVSELYNLM